MPSASVDRVRPTPPWIAVVSVSTLRRSQLIAFLLSFSRTAESSCPHGDTSPTRLPIRLPGYPVAVDPAHIAACVLLRHASNNFLWFCNENFKLGSFCLSILTVQQYRFGTRCCRRGRPATGPATSQGGGAKGLDNSNVSQDIARYAVTRITSVPCITVMFDMCRYSPAGYLHSTTVTLVICKWCILCLLVYKAQIALGSSSHVST